VGEAGRLPFDINTIRTVQFKRTPAGFIAARKKLNALIGSTLANGCKPPVAARVIGAVVGQSADQAFDESEASAVEGVALEATEEHPGVLDAIVDLETGLPEMQSRAESMTSLINDISSLTSTYAEKLDRATKPTQKLALVRSYARELDPLAREYDEEAVEFDSRVTTNGLAVDTLLEHSDAEGEPVEGRQDLLVSLQSMAEAAHDARTKGLAGFYASLGNIERMSRDLRPVIHLLRRALQRTMQDFEAIEAWGERSRAA
jgi:hypothetical protein